MTTSTRISVAPARFLLAAGLAASSVFALALPTLAHAATYAYVNRAGEISSVTADNATIALMTAPNMAVHSGVILLSNQLDFTIVGGSVGGL